MFSNIHHHLVRRLMTSTVLVSAMTLAGCTGETDPAKAGLFDNINNLNKGEYNRQLAQGKSEAARIIRANNAQQTNINSLNNQKRSNAATAGQLRSQIASVQSQLSAAKAKAAGDPAKLARLNQLGGQLASVRAASQSGGSQSALSAELSSIRKSIRALSS
ncbi:hypothetical protein [Profundibacter sp.]